MSILPGGVRKVAVLAALLAGCAPADSEAPGSGSEAAASLVFCGEPRPEVCTRDYRPVCGHRCASPPCPEAERRTYGNGCDACADPAVSAHHSGSCEEGERKEPPKLR